MIFEDTAVDGAMVIGLEEHGDDRGFFARAWCSRESADRHLHTQFVQSNLSYSSHRGTLRGLHYQSAPHAEAKLVRCVRGALFDVVLDLRAESPTYRRWFSVELNAENRLALYIPQGCAHGFQTLADETEAFYQVSDFFCPQSERGVRWNDPAFGIEWPEPNPPVISPKDRSWPDFEERTDGSRAGAAAQLSRDHGPAGLRAPCDR